MFRRIELYLYKYRIYGTIRIYILKYRHTKIYEHKTLKIFIRSFKRNLHANVTLEKVGMFRNSFIYNFRLMRTLSVLQCVWFYISFQCKKWTLLYVYIASVVKHDPNILSVTVFMHNFIQKNKKKKKNIVIHIIP